MAQSLPHRQPEPKLRTMRKSRFRRPRPLSIAIVLLFAAAGITLAIVDRAATPSKPPFYPPATSFYVDAASSAAQWVRDRPDDPRAGDIGTRIASQPQAKWFTNAYNDSVDSDVRAITDAAASQHQVPVLVVYAIPNRDCGGASSGGAGDFDRYRTFVDHLAEGLGPASSIVVLEPDALSNLDCLSAQERTDRFAGLAYAAHTVHQHSPAARVYYDAGNSVWQPDRVMAKRLQQSGINQDGNGIALNVANFNPTSDEVHYGKAILRSLSNHDLGMVIDTSRNGSGAAGGRSHCDPPGRSLGTLPTADTRTSNVDAYLWVKHPGQADGCLASAGTFVPSYAYGLIRR